MRTIHATALTCVTLSAAVLIPSLAVADSSGARSGLPIDLQLEGDRFVTVVIDDASGRRVRNLIAEKPCAAGTNTFSWDGLDDFGRVIAPGEYRVRGLHREPLRLIYQLSLYNAGQPSWLTPDGTGGWLTDHSPPMCALAVGNRIFLGGGGPEANDGLIMTDLEGRKQWGWRYGFRGTTQLATDDKYLYCLKDAGKSVLWHFDISGPKPVEVRFAGKSRFVDVAEYDLGPWRPHTHGMVFHKGRLYLAHTHVNRVLVYDAETADLIKKLSVPTPQGMAVDTDQLYIRTAGKIATLQPDNGELTVVLDSPGPGRAIAFGPQGRMYLGDDETNQVRVFERDGDRWKRALVFGTPGGRELGRYDPSAISSVYGLTVDRRGRAWVANHDFFPKRISVWTPEGRFEREFLGPPMYGGGGSIDPRRPDRAFYNGIEFSVDWERGSCEPYAIVTRVPQPYEALDIKADARGIDGRVVYVGDRRLYVNGGTRMSTPSGALLISEFDEQERIKPLTMVYMSKMPAAEMCVWTDANGDGEASRDEVTGPIRPTTDDGRVFWALSFELADNMDVSVLTAGGVFTLPLAGWSRAGAPQYDLEKLRPQTRSFGGGQVMARSPDGRIVSVGYRVFGFRPDGTREWTYPVYSLGVHGQGRAAPGRIIGAIDIQGTVANQGALGDTFLINGNHGQRFLMTTDGLFVASLLRPYNEGINPSTWSGGERMDAASAGPESFGGFYGASSNGKVYLIAGREDSRVMEIRGLDTVERFQHNLVVSRADTARLADALAQRSRAAVAQANAAAGSPVALPYLGTDARKNADMWRKWVGAYGHKWPVPLEFEVAGRPVTARLAYDDAHLYFFCRAETLAPGRAANAHTDWTELTKSGGAWEVRLSWGSQTRRVVWAPGTAPYVYPGPQANHSLPKPPNNFAVVYHNGKPTRYDGGIEYFLDWQSWPHGMAGMTLRASVPLDVLQLDLKPGLDIRADVGVTLADEGGRKPWTRAFWTSASGGILDGSDLGNRVDPQQLRRMKVAGDALGKTLVAATMTGRASIDGKLDEWPADAFAPLVDERSGKVALGYDGARLLIAARVTTNQLPANNGDDWTQYFKTGAGVDLQLKTDVCQRVLFVPKGQGKAEAVLSREAKYDGAAAWGEVREDVMYESPVGKVTMGQVIRIRADSFDAAFEKTDEGYTMEGAVPLSLLRLGDGSTVLGDVGILFNNPAGTATARRVYWANADTAVIADTPTEARFQPEKWGLLKLPTINAEPAPDPSAATPAKAR